MKKHRQFIKQAMIAAGVILLMLTNVTCKKEHDEPVGNNKVVLSNTTADSVSYFSVKVQSRLSSTGGNTISDHGFCWGIEPNPDISKGHKSNGYTAAPIDISASLKNLLPGKKYYIRSFATFSTGTVYGIQNEFLTRKTGIPVSVTDTITDITYTTALCKGIVAADSGLMVTKRGICWSHTPYPTLTNNFDTTGKGLGSYEIQLGGLNPYTAYYARAFAVNDSGTSYGNQQSFITVALTPLTLTTSPITNFTTTTAESGGNITADGGSSVTARGVCWGISPNPTLSDSHTNDGTGFGNFISNLAGLTPNTLYYVRAYATNSIGIAYGNEVSFSTIAGWLCGTSTLIIYHVAGTTAPVSKTITYSTVTNIPGEPAKCWITKNLGASIQATAVSDATEAAAGWYWQFNRKQGFKHDGNTRTPSSTWIVSISESSDWTTANDPCTLEFGPDWRIPTNSEWTNVDLVGNWTNLAGPPNPVPSHGGSLDSGGWNTWDDPWNSGLKLHAVGCLSYSDGSLNNRGSNGYYWSSTQYSSTYGWILFFYSDSSYMNVNVKAYGYTLRCLRD